MPVFSRGPVVEALPRPFPCPGRSRILSGCPVWPCSIRPAPVPRRPTSRFLPDLVRLARAPTAPKLKFELPGERADFHPLTRLWKCAPARRKPLPPFGNNLKLVSTAARGVSLWSYGG